MTVVSMHEHTALLIRTAHIMSVLLFNPSVQSQSASFSFALELCSNVSNCLYAHFADLNTSFDPRVA